MEPVTQTVPRHGQAKALSHENKRNHATMSPTAVPSLKRFALRTVLLALLSSLLALGASAENSADGKSSGEAVCQKELSKFEQTIALLRQVQGNKAAAEVRERLLPAKLENEILTKDGACGLAKHLRKKRLID
jgi:hypothetical protein